MNSTGLNALSSANLGSVIRLCSVICALTLAQSMQQILIDCGSDLLENRLEEERNTMHLTS